MRRIISPVQRPLSAYLKELLQARELIGMMARRELRVRFAQTYLGVGWLFLSPLLLAGVYTFIFHGAVGLDTGEIPYPLFVLSGMSLWNMFFSIMNNSGNSLLNQQLLLKKVWFPRLAAPVASAIPSLVDFAAILLMVLVGMGIAGIMPSWRLLFLPLVVVVGFVTSLGVGIWFSAVTIRFRDIRLLIPFLLTVFFFLTPVVYPVEIIPEKYAFIGYLNPVTGIINGVRWCLFDSFSLQLQDLFFLPIVAVYTFTGLHFFRKMEYNLADVI